MVNFPFFFTLLWPFQRSIQIECRWHLIRIDPWKSHTVQSIWSWTEVRKKNQTESINHWKWNGLKWKWPYQAVVFCVFQVLLVFFFVRKLTNHTKQLQSNWAPALFVLVIIHRWWHGNRAVNTMHTKKGHRHKHKPIYTCTITETSSQLPKTLKTKKTKSAQIAHAIHVYLNYIAGICNGLLLVAKRCKMIGI